MRAQSAIEFLVTYSWALLIVTIVIAMVFILAAPSSSSTTIPFTCNIQPLLPCTDALLTSTNGIIPIRYLIDFQNNLNAPIYFPNNAFNVTTTDIGTVGTNINFGNCYPNFALPDDRVICYASIPGTIEPGSGSQVVVPFRIQYAICSGSSSDNCPQSYYNSTGYSTLGISAATGNFYSLSFTFNDVETDTPVNGIVILNGVAYAQGANILLTSTGNYVAVAQGQTSGELFVSWDVVQTGTPPTTISNTITTNTILEVGSNSVVEVEVTSLECNICFIYRSSPYCPQVCPCS